MLHLPDSKGRFHLYSDISKFATGSALYQIQNGKPKFRAYPSKRLPETARNYSITELEMCRLGITIATFEHLLEGVDFNALADNLALMHIIKRLLEILSSYSFNLHYIKGKAMVRSDFYLHKNMTIAIHMKLY